MKDYKNIDVSSLTVDDALADEQFGKRPVDYFDYACIGAEQLESVFYDLTISEAGEVLKHYADYCMVSLHDPEDGYNPDYEPNFKEMSSAAVKGMVRTLVKSHRKRMESEFLRHYRQYVSVQKKK